MALLNFTSPFLATPNPIANNFYQPPPPPQLPTHQLPPYRTPYQYPQPQNPFLDEDYHHANKQQQPQQHPGPYQSPQQHQPQQQGPQYTRVTEDGAKTKVHAVIDYDYEDEDGPVPPVTPIQGPIFIKNGSVPVVPLYSHPVLNNGSFVQIPDSQDDTEESQNLDEHQAMPETPLEETLVQKTPEQQRPVQQTPVKQTPIRLTSEKSRGTKRRLQHLSEAVNELRVMNEVLTQPEPTMGENETFGRYVALMLDKLPPRQAILAQSEIQTVLTRYRLANIPEPVSALSPPQTTYTPQTDDYYTSPPHSFDSTSQSSSYAYTSVGAEAEEHEGETLNILAEAWSITNALSP